MTKGEVCEAGSDAGLFRQNWKLYRTVASRPRNGAAEHPTVASAFSLPLRRSGLLCVHFADGTDWLALLRWLLSHLCQAAK